MIGHREIIDKLTDEELVNLVIGVGAWNTYAVEEKGIPSMLLTDGPNGVRCENLASEGADKHNKHNSYHATCFPTESALAATFNKKLLRDIGKQLAKEAKQYGVNVLLGPGVNNKRSPVGGRNFEYFSEDPFLTAELAINYIQALQENGVGCSLKHYYGNNTEFNRFEIDVRIDERTKREIYLKTFEKIVKKAKPATIMAAYNRVDGEYCAENHAILTDTLRKDFGYEGLIISDWGAVRNIVASENAGCNLEMGFDHHNFKEDLLNALKSGELKRSTLEYSVDKLLDLIDKFGKTEKIEADLEKGYEIAKRAGEEGVVLLKNDNVLPLKGDDFCVIGYAATTPRYQGEGSSRVNSHKTTSPLASLEKIFGRKIPYEYGYTYTPGEDNSELVKKATELAKQHEKTVLFIACDDYTEEESSDRKNIRLADKHLKLIDELCAVSKKVIVVLQTGSSTEMPYIDNVAGVIQQYFSGEACGDVIAEILSGKVSPSGRLAETFPVKLEDNPSYNYYDQDGAKMVYGEGIYTGYRYYDTKNVPVRFPFGYGLSYTSFAYSEMKIFRGENKTKVSVKIKNTGNVAGSEVAMLFVSKPGANVPKKELVGFDKYYLNPGEEVNAEIEVADEDISVWNTDTHKFETRKGVYGFAFYNNIGKIATESQAEI